MCVTNLCANWHSDAGRFLSIFHHSAPSRSVLSEALARSGIADLVSDIDTAKCPSQSANVQRQVPAAVSGIHQQLLLLTKKGKHSMWLVVGTDPEVDTATVGIKFCTTLH